MSAASTFNPVKAALRPTVRNDDHKLRVHTGVVDQSTLSSKPPKEVMDDVLRVLSEMGIEIKRENEFRYRCTRVRRRKAGPTTGLGLGSVMSVGSGKVMGSASSSRVSRFLPFRALTVHLNQYLRNQTDVRPILGAYRFRALLRQGSCPQEVSRGCS